MQNSGACHRCLPLISRAAAHVDLVVAQGDDVGGCHASGGQGAGLVRAQDIHAAQGLNGINLTDQDLLLHHSSRSDHQTNCDGGEQTLRNLGEESSRGVAQDLVNSAVHWGHHVGNKGQETHSQRNEGDDVHEMLNLHFQGRSSSRGSGHLGGDLSQECVVTSAKNNALHAALDHCGSEEANVASLHDRKGRPLRGSASRLGQRLAGECSIVYFCPICAEDDAEVSRHLFTGLQLNDVARHQVSGLHPLLRHGKRNSVVSKTADLLCALHGLQRLHHGLSLEFCPPLQSTTGDDDHGQDHWGQHVIAVKDHGQHQLTDHADPQHNVEQPSENLLNKQPDWVLLLRRGQCVLAENLLMLFDLTIRQSKGRLASRPRHLSHVSVQHIG
mmetsp:Transcript_5999/g.14312  ORF Transcript_5999/g.14312 Transcript_5999/m.14312 type:complete len:386 (-) Transcript_5999:587-1744(-)